MTICALTGIREDIGIDVMSYEWPLHRITFMGNLKIAFVWIKLAYYLEGERVFLVPLTSILTSSAHDNQLTTHEVIYACCG